MKESDLEGIPKEGLLKIQSVKVTTLSGAEKTALIRRGNELFNAGRYEEAKRVFLTTGYTDGIVRMGDYYLKEGDPLEALRMYWLAPAVDKREALVERLAKIVHTMVKQPPAAG